MSDDLAKRLRDPIGTDALLDRIEELEAENKKLRKDLELYKRERDRFKHTKPKMSGFYFLTGLSNE